MLDLSKAYDRIEWGYLCATMRKLHFAEMWITLIQLCLTTIQYKVGSGNHDIGPLI